MTGTFGRTLGAWAVVAVSVLILGLAGCHAGRRVCDCPSRPLDPQLPRDPEPCSEYCKVWVPPTYRDKPRIVSQCCTNVEVPATIERTRYRSVCVKPRTCKCVERPGSKCSQAVVQVRPGGYQWVNTGGDCWKYCYVPPCYKWCEKTVTENGILYCAEQPPEYRVEATTERVQVCRNVYVPPAYEVQWGKEVWEPGHYEWRKRQSCECICPQPCPQVDCWKNEPCRPPTPTFLAEGCAACN